MISEVSDTSFILSISVAGTAVKEEELLSYLRGSETLLELCEEGFEGMQGENCFFFFSFFSLNREEKVQKGEERNKKRGENLRLLARKKEKNDKIYTYWGFALNESHMMKTNTKKNICSSII